MFTNASLYSNCVSFLMPKALHTVALVTDECLQPLLTSFPVGVALSTDKPRPTADLMMASTKKVLPLRNETRLEARARFNLFSRIDLLLLYNYLFKLSMKGIFLFFCYARLQAVSQFSTPAPGPPVMKRMKVSGSSPSARPCKTETTLSWKLC